MVGDEVFEDLDHGHPGLPFVGYTGFAADAHDHGVVVHAVDEVAEGGGEYFGIGIYLF